MQINLFRLLVLVVCFYIPFMHSGLDFSYQQMPDLKYVAVDYNVKISEDVKFLHFKFRNYFEINERTFIWLTICHLFTRAFKSAQRL